MEKRFFLVDNLAFSVDNPVDKCITMCEIAGVEHFFLFFPRIRRISTTQRSGTFQSSLCRIFISDSIERFLFRRVRRHANLSPHTSLTPQDFISLQKSDKKAELLHFVYRPGCSWNKDDIFTCRKVNRIGKNPQGQSAQGK